MKQSGLKKNVLVILAAVCLLLVVAALLLSNKGTLANLLIR